MMKSASHLRYILALLCILIVAGCTTGPADKGDANPAVHANGGTTTPTAEGVTRVISDDVVNVGDTVDVKLYINLGADKTYYVAEEVVPPEFEVLDKQTDANNHLKLINIQNPESNIFDYHLKATQKGTFTFSGEYAFDGLNSPVPIMGDNVIVVR